MRKHAPEDAKQSSATSCVKTAILEMIRLPGMKLPESQHRAIVPLKGGYLEILKDANKKAYIEYLPADPKHGITSLVPAKLNLDQVRSGRYTPSRWTPSRGGPNIWIASCRTWPCEGCFKKPWRRRSCRCAWKSLPVAGKRQQRQEHLASRPASHPPQEHCGPHRQAGWAVRHGTSRFQDSLSGDRGAQGPSDPIQQVLKALISRDPMSAENKGKDAYTTVPRGTLFLALNAMFSVTSPEHGFWRKICMIPFNVRLAENDKDRDPDFHKKLTEDPAEMAVKTGWLGSGHRLIERGGLPEEMPEAAALAEQTRQETDTTASYFAERMVIEEEGTWTDKNDIYADYRNYVLDEPNGKPVLKSFGSGCANGCRGSSRSRRRRRRDRRPSAGQRERKPNAAPGGQDPGTRRFRWVTL
jgi:hypothetical protein